MPLYSKEHLGSLLVKAGIITPEALAATLAEIIETGGRLGETLIAKGLTTEDEIQKFLAIQLGYPTVRLDRTYIDLETARTIPEKFARRFGVLPLYRSESATGPVVVVAMTDPSNIMVQDEIRKALGEEIFATLAAQSEMTRFLDRIWTETSEEEMPVSVESERRVLPRSSAEEKPSVAALLEMIFKQALEMRAASIHLEPKQKFVAVRYKIDGQFQSVTSLPRETFQAVLTRIKILGKIPVSESITTMEEGRFHIRLDAVKPFIDVRVNIVPAAFGEKAVLKLTRRDEIIRPLDELGFEQEQWTALSNLVARRSGLVLLAGKNEGGKTTLAYSILSHIEAASNMIVTVEDPPAYPIAAFNQIGRVTASSSKTSAWDMTLKSVECQEPNVVYLAGVDTVEEFRMLLRLGAQGRHVLASLYADDATSAHWVALQRGADSFAVASVLSGVIATRVVRRICETCRVAAPVTPEELARLGIKSEAVRGKVFYKGKGCERCGGTGYFGRLGVYEVMTAHEHIKGMIEEKAPSDVIRKAAAEAGMMTMVEAGLAKAARGLTTIEEIIAALL
jgi:type II secretory ATPase GspE/PulE/Tfp pilus assembly ATPase PilB-like protein